MKICGLTRRVDAEHAAGCGADYVGVVLAPGGRRSVAVEDAAIMLRDLGPLPPRKVGVFVDADPDQLRRAAEGIGLDVLQLHGDESPATVRAARAEGPWEVWKAVRPRNAAEFLDALDRYGADADGLLLDGWSDEARGGTGECFPWEAVAAERRRVPHHLALIAAGGLRSANVAAAIALLSPDVVDVSSGVEHSPGAKDPHAVRQFVSRVRAHVNALSSI